MTRNNWIFVCFAYVILFFGLAGCSSENEGPSTPHFRLTATGFEYDGYSSDVNLYASYDGVEYVISVDATDDVKWNVELKDANGVTVSPIGEQTGCEDIVITVAANPDHKQGMGGTVSISEYTYGTHYEFRIIQSEKQLYLPDGLQGQKESEYYDGSGKYNVNYMREGTNVALLWEKSFGANPMNSKYPFDPDIFLYEAEKAYDFITGKLGFGTDPFTSKYKVVVFVPYNDEEVAHGGCFNFTEKDNKKNSIPVIYDIPPFFYEKATPNNIKSGNGCVMYHEMCHCFQFISEQEPGVANMFNMTKAITEMTSQWAVLQRFPNYIDLEEWEFDRFLPKVHLSMGHYDNRYCNPYMLNYWSLKHGIDVISRMWKSCKQEDGSDFVRTYMRITNTSDERLGEEVYDAVSRFVTWDFENLQDTYVRKRNIHTCKLIKNGVNYKIHSDNCPQNYGYNAICLIDYKEGDKVTVTFEGLPKDPDFKIQFSERAQWKWGFVAYKKDGSREYSKHMSGIEGKLEYTVPVNTEYLWLIVAATPTKYFFVYSDDTTKEMCEWPYQFSINGASPGNKTTVQ